jgi:hypothetical protein
MLEEVAWRSRTRLDGIRMSWWLIRTLQPMMMGLEPWTLVEAKRRDDDNMCCREG